MDPLLSPYLGVSPSTQQWLEAKLKQYKFKTMKRYDFKTKCQWDSWWCLCKYDYSKWLSRNCSWSAWNKFMQHLTSLLNLSDLCLQKLFMNKQDLQIWVSRSEIYHIQIWKYIVTRNIHIICKTKFRSRSTLRWLSSSLIKSTVPLSCCQFHYLFNTCFLVKFHNRFPSAQKSTLLGLKPS